MAEVFKDDLVNKLNKVIQDRRITHKDAAAFIGVSSAAVSRWLNGKNSIANRYRQKVNEFLETGFKNGDKTIVIKVSNFPIKASCIQEFVDYFSLPENKAELLRLYAKTLDNTKR
ncbi:LacI family DNA-binding transcriptional regulator [Lentisphaerota bacterium ZTH]|nr:LacI family DNA-binding transcriptional regulator [Lentisphaerota bacterium]WET07494.1 LacI family DNA-binding transcriptional regulator [Lentisphaerota bacterium ZTH]